ncbi:follistatin-like [Anneissia japonica]|uniref:follistatin-like n=1 Tax=Anneissia japonica TaxID=1529436 RepID=UPI00142587F6|nr:follistatin-like [Anneissia japonica]
MKHTVAILVPFLYSMISFSSGGDCYDNYRGDTKGCTGRITTNITKSDCCNLEGVGGTSFGWTATDASGESFFRSLIEGHSTPGCIPCNVDCDDVDCGPDKKCRMRKHRPVCFCNLNCSKYDAEHDGAVCGTNDKTYDRPCKLYRSRCRLGESFEIAYYGVCTNSCEHVNCRNGRHCIQDRYGRPYCVECWAMCQDAVSEFVCGSDNITYESKCQLQLQSCRYSQVTKIANHRCNGTLDTCEFTRCMDGKKCEDTDQGAVCVPCGFTCTNADYKGKVCGADNRTYVDRCALKTERCRNNPDLELISNTSCDGGQPASIPPFFLDIYNNNNDAAHTEQSWPSNAEYEEDDDPQITVSYFSNRPINELKLFLQKGILPNITGARRGNKRRINNTKNHSQSTKSSGNRHFQRPFK